MISPCCLGVRVCFAPVMLHRLSEQGAAEFHVTRALVITGITFYRFAVN
jgi:hypothetical protein